jgi:hypothetical protein
MAIPRDGTHDAQAASSCALKYEATRSSPSGRLTVGAHPRAFIALIVGDKGEVRMIEQMPDVVHPAGQQAVERDHFMILGDQTIAKMGSDKAGTACTRDRGRTLAGRPGPGMPPGFEL